MTHSVVSTRPAIEAEFCRLLSTTLAESTMPDTGEGGHKKRGRSQGEGVRERDGGAEAGQTGGRGAPPHEGTIYMTKCDRPICQISLQNHFLGDRTCFCQASLYTYHTHMYMYIYIYMYLKLSETTF
jgi:hypothetical protein